MSLLHIGGSGSSVVVPEGVDFDGVSDYLSRSSDLVGNVDSKTFTFSAWVYRVTSSQQVIISSYTSGVGEGIHIYISSGNQLYINCYNSSGTAIVVGYSQSILTSNTFFNILISLDTSSQGNSRLYINDIQSSITWTTFTNSFIDCTKPNHSVSSSTTGTNKLKGRLSNLFIDYTYRDLSIEANRRLFITAEGKPTPTGTLKALNPILYLPMKDNATAHINEGTGGNFTLNGTIATSERGANQDNCVASYFDGSADYLSRTSSIGVAPTKTITISFNFKPSILDSTRGIYRVATNTANGVFYVFYTTSVLRIYANRYNGVTGGENVLDILISSTYLVLNKTNTITVSFDLANIAKRHVYINGIAITPTWAKYITLYDIYIISSDLQRVGSDYDNSGLLQGTLGELYFDTKYIDLATNNPFWDKDTNKPVPVRKVIANTGVTPLIAMPLDASNAGKNYGAGGGFTANSAPYVGARGASEFWARSAKFTQNVNNRFDILNNTDLSNQKKVTICICFKFDFTSNPAAQPDIIYRAMSASTDYQLGILRDTDGYLYLSMNGYQVFKSTAQLVTADLWYTLLVSIDSTQTKADVYLNGVVQSSSITLDKSFSHYRTQIAAYPFYGSLAIVYHSNEFIDFSQETNRLKFVDCLGYPTNLKEKIDNGIIPKPLIYLPFEDSNNAGKNNGILGDFVLVSGHSFSNGADVLG